MPTTTDAIDDLARATLLSSSDGRIELGVPGTDYRLSLIPAAPIAAQVGKRVRGRIEGRALRLHIAAAGGRFIEPLAGAPRIVQGTVAAVDAAGRRLLLDVCVPIWITLDGDRSTDAFTIGTLVNFYMESGARFTPA